MEIPTNNNQIINKEILYYENPLIITSISGINEDDIEECVKKILKDNPSIVFNTIQYSKEYHRIYFYTTDKISIESWKEKTQDQNLLSPLETNTEILAEIKKILLNKNQETTCISIDDNTNLISLYEVSNLIKETYQRKKKIEDEFQKSTEKRISIHTDFWKDYIKVSNFDYEEGILSLYVSIFYSPRTQYIKVKRKDEDLVLVNELSPTLNEKYQKTSDLIDDIYDKLLEFRDFHSQTKSNIKAVGTNFLINIDNTGITIHNKLNSFSVLNKSYTEDYEYKSTSTNILTTLYENEKELYKRIMIRISDCPEWMHKTLYQRREEELTEKRKQQQFQQEQLEKEEEKKQKKLEFRRKYLPFLK